MTLRMTSSCTRIHHFITTTKKNLLNQFSEVEHRLIFPELLLWADYLLTMFAFIFMDSSSFSPFMFQLNDALINPWTILVFRAEQ